MTAHDRELCTGDGACACPCEVCDRMRGRADARSR